MNYGYAAATARRVWFVPNFVVWGLPVWGEVELLMIESVDGSKSIGYNAASLSDTAQQVDYADLTDHRGNQLPDSIPSPRVIVRPRGADAVFVTGSETDSSFKIAHDPDAGGPVTVDLLIVEMGN